MLLGFKDFLAESNRMAPLYHGTPAFFVINIIMSKMISANTDHAHDRTSRRRRKLETKPVVSLTRSLQFAKNWGERTAFYQSSDYDYVVLELDQQALTHNYKFVPYNHFQDERYTRLKPAARQMQDVINGFPINQYEENVIGDIKNLPRYLKAIHVPKGIDTKYLKFLESYKGVDGYNFEIKYLK